MPSIDYKGRERRFDVCVLKILISAEYFTAVLMFEDMTTYSAAV